MDIKSIRMKYRKAITPLVSKLDDASDDEQAAYELGLKVLEHLYDVLHSAGCYHFHVHWFSYPIVASKLAYDAAEITLSLEDSEHRSRPERALEACRNAGYHVRNLRKIDKGRYGFSIANARAVAETS